MSASRVQLVAWHVFKEGARDRVLFTIIGFSVRELIYTRIRYENLIYAFYLVLWETIIGQDPAVRSQYVEKIHTFLGTFILHDFGKRGYGK